VCLANQKHGFQTPEIYQINGRFFVSLENYQTLSSELKSVKTHRDHLISLNARLLAENNEIREMEPAQMNPEMEPIPVLDPQV
jgi:hypothetical protein